MEFGNIKIMQRSGCRTDKTHEINTILRVRFKTYRHFSCPLFEPDWLLRYKLQNLPDDYKQRFEENTVDYPGSDPTTHIDGTKLFAYSLLIVFHLVYVMQNTVCCILYTLANLQHFIK